MENKGKVITKPSPKMPHRNEEHKSQQSRKDHVALCITYWIIASMFSIALLVEIYGAVTSRLSFSGIMLTVTLVPMIIYVVLAMLEMRKLKK